MKKSILIISTVLLTFSLAAYGLMSSKEKQVECKAVKPLCKAVTFDMELINPLSIKTDPPLTFNVDHRFLTNISKEKLLNARSILDIIPAEATENLSSYQHVKVAVLAEEMEYTETGIGEILNFNQLSLLSKVDYADNFYIRAKCENKNTYNGYMEDYDLVYYITVIPEKEAQYEGGNDKLNEYLKENGQKIMGSLKRSQLKPGQVSFEVTKTGEIADIKLDSTCGFTEIDEEMMDLISNLPGKWQAASNEKGERINQQLTYFFGIQGC
jgi:hypothetical protein